MTMNTSIRRLAGLAAAAVAATAFLTVLPGAAAQATAPAPHCESGGSRYFCDAASVGTTTWNVTYVYPPAVTVIYTTAGSTLSTSCPGGKTVRVFYSYDLNGVTETSSTRGFICNPGAWP